MMNKELHFVGNGAFEIRNLNREFVLKTVDLLVKVDACGVCGSDFGYVAVSNHTKKNSIILGHEISGTVLKIGKSIKNFKEGDRVVVNPGLNCDNCEHCKKGNPNLCNNTEFYGYPPFKGGFQQYMVLPAKACYAIPDNLDSVTAIMVEPLAVSLHSLNLSKFKHGMDSLIIGAGGIGLTLLKLLKNYSSGKIIVSEPVEYRRNMAKEIGADVVVNPFEEDVTKVVMQNTSGNGLDRVFDASGDANVLPIAIKTSKTGAQIILIGIPKDDVVTFSHSEARKKGLTIKMERTINNTMIPAINILNKDASYSKFIKYTSTLDEMVEDFEKMKNYQMNSIKNVIVFN
jgi:L-iditol 2-dehydrogenase